MKLDLQGLKNLKIAEWMAGWVKNFTWTRNRIIAAAAAGVLVVLGIGYNIGQQKPPEIVVVTPQEHDPMDASEKGLPPAVVNRIEQMSYSAMWFIFFHETGHMLITELNLPATGPEEDVADEFATFVLTDAMKAAPKREQKMFLADIIYSGAVFWRITAQIKEAQTGGKVTNGEWQDEHSPDMKRYYNVICLATGADPVIFIPKAVEDGMTEARLMRCSDEYQKKHEAWTRIFDPHVKNIVERVLGMGGHMKLEMGPYGKNEYLVYEKMYQAGNFQSLLDYVSNALSLPENVPVTAQGCDGTVNAFWSPDDKKITLCHEMMQYIIQTYTAFFRAKLAQAQQQQGGDQQNPPQQGSVGEQPQQQGSGGEQPQQQYPQQQGGAMSIAGNWLCQGRTQDTGEAFTETDALAPDGSWRMVSRRQSGFTLNAWGRWSAQGNVIYYQIGGYSPQQACNQNGCMPLNLPRAFQVPFQLRPDGLLVTQSGMCRRQ